MKLSKNQLRQMLDGLPNPMEYRHEKYKCVKMPESFIQAMWKPNIKFDYDKEIENNTVEFKIERTSRGYEWFLELPDLNPLNENISKLKSELREVKSELFYTKQDLENKQRFLRVTKACYDDLKSKWYNKLASKIECFIIDIKAKIFKSNK